MIELWHEWNSVHSFKVRVVLAEKAIPWTSRPIELLKFEHLQPAYRRLNPDGVVPTLVHDEHVIRESTVICQYLEDIAPSPSLMPDAPHERAQARAWLKYFDEHVHAPIRAASFQLLYRPLLAALPADELEARLRGHPDPARAQAFRAAACAPFDETAVRAAAEAFPRIATRLEESLSEREWLAGDSFSLADAAMAPFVERIAHLEMASIWDDYPRAARWARAVQVRPSVIAAAAPAAHRFPLHRQHS